MIEVPSSFISHPSSLIMPAKFSNSELEAFLEEALPIERMAAIEEALRGSDELQHRPTTPSSISKQSNVVTARRASSILNRSNPPQTPTSRSAAAINTSNQASATCAKSDTDDGGLVVSLD